jgi:putative membrane protein
MNRTSLAAVSLILGAALLHCGGDQKGASAPTPTMAPAELPPAPINGPDAGAPPEAQKAATNSPSPNADPTQPVPASAEVFTDEQIAAITDGANQAEIEQGKLARLKSKDRDVLKFAAQMIAAHEEAKKNQDKLGLKTADSVLGNTLGTEAASTQSSLKSADGKDFDKAYIDAQVTEHQKLLDALNDKLLPSVKNPDLKAYLTQIQPHVARHLKEAQEIQHALAVKIAAAPATPAAPKTAAQ